MAIEGIKANVMSPVKKVSEPVTVGDGKNVQVKPQQTDPVIKKQTDYRSKDGQEKNPADEEKNLSDVSSEKVEKMIAEINRQLKPTHTQCEFKYHEKTNRLMISIKDSETDEILKEFPTEKSLDMFAKTLELAGLLVDERG